MMFQVVWLIVQLKQSTFPIHKTNMVITIGWIFNTNAQLVYIDSLINWSKISPNNFPRNIQNWTSCKPSNQFLMQLIWLLPTNVIGCAGHLCPFLLCSIKCADLFFAKLLIFHCLSHSCKLEWMLMSVKSGLARWCTMNKYIVSCAKRWLSDCTVLKISSSEYIYSIWPWFYQESLFRNFDLNVRPYYLL